MAARRKISPNTTTGAPSGENTSLAGTEYVPISGSQVTLISTIAAYIRTLVQTFTGKTINLTDNTLTGTKAQFNTAMSDADFATLTGSETLTNKTLTSPTITTPSISGAISFPDGVRQTFNPDGTNAGINVGSQAGDPASPSNGDVWYDSTSNTLDARINGATVNLGAGGNSFGTVAVSGQSDVVADAPADTVTYVAGTGMVITTNAGSDSVTFAASGGAFVLNTNTTPVGNITTGEDDLITYSVPGDTLDTNGQYIHFVMGGTFAASVNNKRIKVKLGSTTLFDTGALVISAAGDWNIEGYIIRTGSATQRCQVEFESNETALAGSADYVDATEDLTTSLTLKATGEATATDDVIQKFLIVEKGGGTGGVGVGDFVGPASSTDNAVVRFDGTTGKLGQNSVMTVDDSGTVNIPSAQTYNINGSAHTHAQAAGQVVQVVNTQTGAVSTGTTVLPVDDTIPQNTEGDQYMTLAITPTNASNILYIDVTILATPNTTHWVTAALFQDTTVNALAAMGMYTETSTAGSPIYFKHKMTAGTTSVTTFKVRAGKGAAGTTTFNGQAGGRIFGGVMASSITITEVKV